MPVCPSSACTRQATAAGQLNGCPFPRNALFVFEIGKASRSDEGRSLVFMDRTWSSCPRRQWVPAMLEGVWRRAIQETPLPQRS